MNNLTLSFRPLRVYANIIQYFNENYDSQISYRRSRMSIYSFDTDGMSHRIITTRDFMMNNSSNDSW